MRVLLALLPYLASIAIYLVDIRELFARAGGIKPSDTEWRLIAPVVVGAGLLPLAVAPSARSGRLIFLFTAFAVSMVYVGVALLAVRDPARFRWLLPPIRIRRLTLKHISKRVLLTAFGVAAIVYGAVVDELVANPPANRCTIAISRVGAGPQKVIVGDDTSQVVRLAGDRTGSAVEVRARDCHN